jgi:glycosyltransferase involved in cell wall biosynthesis
MMPQVSIIIPIYNEEELLESSIAELAYGLKKEKIDYELTLTENGSRDRTRDIAYKLARTNERIKVITTDQPNYGLALKKGIIAARAEKIVCFELDYWDIGFLKEAISLLSTYDVVVASKRAPGARDERPFIRRAITFGFNLFLHLLLGFKGSDTHGIKAFNKKKIIPIATSCRTEKDIFSSELLIRAERAGLQKKEIPTVVAEKRGSRVSVLNRVPSAIKNTIRLFFALRK